ncbi:class I SAM-dependent methyltransferase, partial [Microbacterium sp. Bi128]|uniref:class I SAM-dependent methyltransferase n=1 Tax=Microbacterium sp. Bi128 TaxID=2821115 RepID=UPI001E308B9F
MTEATGSGTGRAQGTTHSSAVAGSAVDSGLVTSRVPYTVPQPPATIDAAIWPSIATVPSSLKARVAGRAADAIFKAAVRRLPLEVRYPDGTVLGKAALGTAPSDQVPAGTASDQAAAGYPVMTINRPVAFATRLGDGGLIGLGESFMAGDWDADDLTAVMEVFASRVGTLVPEPLQKLRGLYLPRQPRRERNTEKNTRSNISRHYDLSNELFASFLDSTMTYSSALFPESGDSLRNVAWDGLAAAQQAKIDRLLDKAGVKEGTRVLEIGTGWGELALRAAARGATVYSVTLSSEQQELARQRVAEAG